MSTFALRFLQEIAAAPSWRIAETIIDRHRDDLSVMEPGAKEELLCQVADLFAEIAANSD